MKKNVLKSFLLLIIHLSLYTSGIASYQYGKLKFQKFTIDNGLSNNWVTCITQDDYGNMWFGTQNGLNKFDGYSFTPFTKKNNDTTSISGNYILCVENDGNDIWVGTQQNGLCRYDSDKHIFKRYYNQYNCDSCLAYRSIRSLLLLDNEVWAGFLNGIMIYDKDTKEFRDFHYNHLFPADIDISSMVYDGSDYIYFGANTNCLYRYSRQTDSLDTILLPGLEHKSWPQIFEKDVFIDSDGDLWIGSHGNGLWIYYPDKDRFDRFTSSSGTNRIVHDLVMGFEQVEKDIVFIATDNGGISVYDKKNKKLSAIQANTSDPFALSSNGIYHIFKDKDARIWIATFDAGINMWDPNKNRFFHYYHIVNNPNTLSHNNVISLCEGINDDVWIGTDGGGLNRLFPETGQVKHFRMAGDEKYPVNSNYIIALTRDSRDRLWISGLYSGVTVLNLKTGKAKHFYHNGSGNLGFPNNPVWDIMEDKQGMIWFATMGAGLYCYNEEKNKFKSFLFKANDSFSDGANFILDIKEDTNGFIWIATEGGSLIRFNPLTESYTFLIHDEFDSTSISSNIINGIYRMSNGDLWFTTDNGLDLLNPDQKTFTVYRQKDGLPNNRTHDILEDNNGLLWISTDNGLSQFNPATQTFRNFDKGDGLQSNQFNKTAALKDKRGMFYFGGVYGLNAFYPDSIHEHYSQPTVILTELRIFNQPVSPQSANSPLDKHISGTDHFTLNYDQNVFSLEFAALDFTNPQKIKYKYQLEGFNNNWIETTFNQRRVTFTNLSSGKYIFKVRSTNSDGLWTDQMASVRITVLPPFWETWWFRVILLLIISGFLYGLHLYRTLTMKKRNLELLKINIALGKQIEDRKKAERTVKKSLKEKELLLKEIHHRVKNNLQVISSLLYLQSSKIKDPQLLEMFNDNKNRIRSMAIIHEKMYQSRDFEYIDFNSYITSLIYELKCTFNDIDKKIDFIIDIQGVNFTIDIAVPCGLIINELITNAFKHAFPSDYKGTPQIKVIMNNVDNQIQLCITDNGVGLQDSVKLENIDSLGLTLVQKITTYQLRGKVDVCVNGGTTWTIKFNIDPKQRPLITAPE